MWFAEVTGERRGTEKHHHATVRTHGEFTTQILHAFGFLLQLRKDLIDGEGQQLVLGYGMASRPGKVEIHSFPGKHAAGGGQERELKDHRWPWERDQPFRDMKQGVSTGIREQLVQNQHRKATGCLVGAKGAGGLKNRQTHLWGKKKYPRPQI